MPWVRRSSHKNTHFYWLVAGIVSVVVGILAGYSWWGDTASVVTIVEQQLSQSHSQLRSLERRVQALEEKLAVDNNPGASAKGY
jgi:cell division protein FtsB